MTAEIQWFAKRVTDERERRNWSMRELANKSGISVSTMSRLEAGHEVWLSAALRICAALEMSLDEMARRPACAQCYDTPPPGFTCNACGTESRP